MKLRLYENSIRLRLSRSEVEKIAREEHIEQQVDLVPEPLIYRLSAASDCMAAAATFSNGILRITLPASDVRQWASTEQIGIEATLPAQKGSQNEISLLVEKDFQCLHDESTSQKDYFVNPLAPTR